MIVQFLDRCDRAFMCQPQCPADRVFGVRFQGSGDSLRLRADHAAKGFDLLDLEFAGCQRAGLVEGEGIALRKDLDRIAAHRQQAHCRRTVRRRSRPRPELPVRARRDR